MNNKDMNQFEIKLVDTINLPTSISESSKFYLFKNGKDVISALVKGDVFNKSNVLIRIHSECLFGDILGSYKCDCGQQLENAKQLMKKEEIAILFYLEQEGRGIGIENKVKAYKLQEQGHDTVDANLLLGLQADMRSYDSVAKIIKQFFKIDSIRLLTNNPDKIDEVQKAGIAINQIPLVITPNVHNKKYLITKKSKFGHYLP